MGHINTTPGAHDYTVGVYIVNLEQDQPRVLLHKHRKLGMYMPIGGHVETTESLSQAILREIHEESGYTPSDLQLLQPKDRIKSFSDIAVEPQPLTVSVHHLPEADHYHTDCAFVFTTTKPIPGPTNEDESNDFLLLNSEELKELEDDTIFPHTKELYLYILNTTLRVWEKIDALTISVKKTL